VSGKLLRILGWKNDPLVRLPDCFPESLAFQVFRCKQLNGRIPELKALRPVSFGQSAWDIGKDEALKIPQAPTHYQHENYGKVLLEAIAWEIFHPVVPEKHVFLFLDNRLFMGIISMGRESLPRLRVLNDVIISRNYPEQFGERCREVCHYWAGTDPPMGDYLIRGDDGSRIHVHPHGLKLEVLVFKNLPSELETIFTHRKFRKENKDKREPSQVF
jgi:hypothetical protein